MLLRVSIALLVFLVTIELTARAARYFVPAGQSNDNPFPFIVPDPVLGWTNAPTPLLPQLAFDPRGYRVVPHASDQKAINVLCLGDSGTFGIYRDEHGQVRFNNDWPRLLSDRLTELGTPNRIFNAGCLGYDTSHGILQLKAHTGPLDFVIIRYGWNDHASPSMADSRARDSFLRQLLKRSAAAHWMVLLLKLDVIPSSDGPRVPLETFRKNLHELLELAAARGATPVLVDYPIGTFNEESAKVSLIVHRGFCEGAACIVDLHEKYRSILKETASERGIVWIDGSEEDASHFSAQDPVHLNEKGAQSLADELARTLHEHL